MKNNNFKYKHGESKTRLFRIWAHMRGRCKTPSDQRYADYGGRGIKVTPEWDDFLAFKDWALKNGYNEKLTLDRIDNNGNYEPNNCRWATNKMQCNNRRSNRIIEVDGLVMNEREWAEFLCIPSYILRTRLHRGMSEEEAIKTPVRTNINGKYINVDYYKLAKERIDRETAQMNIWDFIGDTNGNME